MPIVSAPSPVVAADLTGRVRRALDALIPKTGAPLALAVSGGGDSMALLHLVAAWCAEGNRHPIVMTVDHGLRPEAKTEARLVADVCNTLGVAHEILIWSPPTTRRVSQSDARHARYRLLSTAMREAGADTLLTGHTADDQAETFLMRARAGSGWYGLAGMAARAPTPVWPEGRNIHILRPLLTLRRHDLRAYLMHKGQAWCEDPTNADLRHERPRMRKSLSHAEETFRRITSTQAKLMHLRCALDRTTAAWLSTAITAHDDGIIEIHNLPHTDSVLTHGLRLLFMAAAGTDQPARGPSLRRLVNALRNAGFGGGATLGGARIAWRKNRLLIARDPGSVSPCVPRADTIWDGRFMLGTYQGHGRALTTFHPLARPGLPARDGHVIAARCLIADRLNAWIDLHKD